MWSLYTLYLAAHTSARKQRQLLGPHCDSTAECRKSGAALRKASGGTTTRR
jgi:hypothetical protein